MGLRRAEVLSNCDAVKISSPRSIPASRPADSTSIRNNESTSVVATADGLDSATRMDYYPGDFVQCAPPVMVPEPATLGLIGVGLASVTGLAGKKRRHPMAKVSTGTPIATWAQSSRRRERQAQGHPSQKTRDGVTRSFFTSFSEYGGDFQLRTTSKSKVVLQVVSPV